MKLTAEGREAAKADQDARIAAKQAYREVATAESATDEQCDEALAALRDYNASTPAAVERAAFNDKIAAARRAEKAARAAFGDAQGRGVGVQGASAELVKATAELQALEAQKRLLFGSATRAEVTAA